MELLHSRIQSNDPRSIRDDGTYLRVQKQYGDSVLRATMMPFDSDRMRLGYLWDITWGGNTVFPDSTVTPGVELEWLAQKAHRAIDDLADELEDVHDLLLKFERGNEMVVSLFDLDINNLFTGSFFGNVENVKSLGRALASGEDVNFTIEEIRSGT